MGIPGSDADKAAVEISKEAKITEITASKVRFILRLIFNRSKSCQKMKVLLMTNLGM